MSDSSAELNRAEHSNPGTASPWNPADTSLPRGLRRGRGVWCFDRDADPTPNLRSPLRAALPARRLARPCCGPRPTIRADVIVASGDFTQRAKPAQFAAARAFLDRLPHGSADRRAWQSRHSALSGSMSGCSPRMPCIGNTSRPNSKACSCSTTRRSWRSIRPRRCERLPMAGSSPGNSNLPATPFGPRRPMRPEIVVAHHHFAPAPDSERKHDATIGARAALECFDRLGVESDSWRAFASQLHRQFARRLYGRATASTGILIVECGTSTSSRGRGRETRQELAECHPDRRPHDDGDPLALLGRGEQFCPGQPAHISPPGEAFFLPTRITHRGRLASQSSCRQRRPASGEKIDRQRRTAIERQVGQNASQDRHEFEPMTR